MLRKIWILPAFVLMLALNAYPCQRSTQVSSVEMVNQADVIVRAIAEKYEVAPKNPNVVTTGIPDSTVQFHVLEVIRGDARTDLILPGYLGNKDDFNDHPSPYNFVRPGGRAGSCFANTYRSGSQFLLLLKKQQSGELTVNWYALGPVNEQLHSMDDPWLLWVRAEAQKAKSAKNRAADDKSHSNYRPPNTMLTAPLLPIEDRVSLGL
jgi:hypothetical protein